MWTCCICEGDTWKMAFFSLSFNNLFSLLLFLRYWRHYGYTPCFWLISILGICTSQWRLVMAMISKRRRNEASILTSFSISKRNEPAYCRSLFISQIWKNQAERTLFIPQIRKIEAKRSLFVPQIRKIEAERTRLIPEIGKIKAKKKWTGSK